MDFLFVKASRKWYDESISISTMSQEFFAGSKKEVSVSEDEGRYADAVRAMMEEMEDGDAREAVRDALERYGSNGNLDTLRGALEYASLGRLGPQYFDAVSNGKDTSGMAEQMKKRAEDPAYQARYDDFVALANRHGLLELGEKIDRANGQA